MVPEAQPVADLQVTGVNRQTFLTQIHQPIQKIVLQFCTIPLFCVFVYWHVLFPSWQSVVLLCGIITLAVIWIIGYRLARMDRIDASVTCFLMATLGQATLVMLVLKGFNYLALLPMLAATVYAGLFSKRQLYSSGIIAMVAPLTSELIRASQLYPMFVVDPNYKLVPTVIVCIFVGGPITAYFLIRSQVISGTMVRSLEKANEEQQQVIATIHQFQPEIDLVVAEIRQISSEIATQSSEQAAVTSEISATMNVMAGNAVKTASNAAQTQEIAEKTRAKSLRNSAHLKSVEQGFNKVMTIVGNGAKEVTALADQMDRIEEILAFNREIGEQIKVLAINASMEADRAGQYGKGFGAVAAEYKNMMLDTEENLSTSRILLHAIRDQARTNSLTVIEGSDQLTRYFEALRATGQTVALNVEQFYNTAKQVARISASAGRQQTRVAEVNTTMRTLEQASMDLNTSSVVLMENVAKIETAQEKLFTVLAEKQQGANHSHPLVFDHA